VRLIIGIIGTVALSTVLIGCGSATPGQSAGPTLAPGATATPAGGATTGHECDGVPTFSPSNPAEPSFPADPEVEAHFPATIDGQPVTEVKSQQWRYFLCYLGGQASFNQSAGQAAGLNLASSSLATAEATVDGESVDLNAWRTPGQDANSFIQYLQVLANQAGSDITVANVQQTNVAGKNVFTWTDTDDGTKSFAYPSGDTLVYFDSVTDSQATKILSALP
jgi:hypothetical protein